MAPQIRSPRSRSDGWIHWTIDPSGRVDVRGRCGALNGDRLERLERLMAAELARIMGEQERGHALAHLTLPAHSTLRPWARRLAAYLGLGAWLARREGRRVYLAGSIDT